MSETQILVVQLVIGLLVLTGSLIVAPNLFGVSLGPLWSAALRGGILIGLVMLALLIPTYGLWLTLLIWVAGFRFLFGYGWPAVFMLAAVNWLALALVRLANILIDAFSLMLPS